MDALALDIAARSEPGGREHNEDFVVFSCHAGRGSAVLCDGAGGHAHGALAAELAARTVHRHLQRAPQWGAAPLVAAVHAGHAAVNEGQRGLRGRERMHATVVALWLDTRAGLAHWAHVGDSRLYRLRQGRAQQLTRDDSVLQQLVDAGLLTPAEAREHPGRSQLMAALGSCELPDIHVNQPASVLHDGDAFLLCSDGWWDAFDPAALEHSLRQAHSATQWLDQMAAQVRHGAPAGQDNYSAIAVWVVAADPGTPARLPTPTP